MPCLSLTLQSETLTAHRKALEKEPDGMQKENKNMEGNLVIVESPAKAGTIQKFLGKDYTVKSSFGHIRDLKDNSLSIDVNDRYKP